MYSKSILLSGTGEQSSVGGKIYTVKWEYLKLKVSHGKTKDKIYNDSDSNSDRHVLKRVECISTSTSTQAKLM